MRTNVIALRIDNYTADLIEKIIKYKLADNKADALRLIMQNGIQSDNVCSHAYTYVFIRYIFF